MFQSFGNSNSHILGMLKTCSLAEFAETLICVGKLDGLPNFKKAGQPNAVEVDQGLVVSTPEDSQRS